ncbi:putative glutamate decarboxylase isozyme [Escherichia coli 2-005-03_S3_C3]|nr:putative glutamate decarboxylase isozyme [Escherichia coli 2-005-03_S3_C3]
MNINAGHEITSKARIIHQIQLIRGITNDISKKIKSDKYLKQHQQSI